MSTLSSRHCDSYSQVQQFPGQSPLAARIRLVPDCDDGGLLLNPRQPATTDVYRLFRRDMEWIDVSSEVGFGVNQALGLN